MNGTVVRYHAESTVCNSDLWLAGADVGHPPLFFDGFLLPGEQSAQALLTVAKVAATRFYIPPGMVAAMISSADPVITANEDRLRFESFSLCCGVAARYDVLPAGLDQPPLAVGTTNIDLNPPVRAALAEIRGNAALHLSVGTDVTVTTKTAQLVERKVPLPDRWVRGFAESQAVTAGLVEKVQLTARQFGAFLRTLPRSSSGRSVLYATPARSGLRLTGAPGREALPVGGAERLRVIEPMLRFVRSVRAYGPTDPGAGVSAWQLDLADGRMTVTLSPSSSRGFSGEGGLLFDLADRQAAEDATLLAALLSWESVVDLKALARAADLPQARVRRGLVHLAAAGQVGYDAAEQAYFARVLPWDRARLERLNPRLSGAHALVGAGAVAEVNGRYEVRSGDSLYVVRPAADHTKTDGTGTDGPETDGPETDHFACTCPWFAQHGRSRGPCKHILAVTLYSRRSQPTWP